MKNTLKRALTVLTALVMLAALAFPATAFAAADGNNRDTDVIAEVEVSYDVSFVDENGIIPPLTGDMIIGSLQNGDGTLLEEGDLLDITLDASGVLTNEHGDTLPYTVSIDGPGVIDPDTGVVKYPLHVVVDWTGAVIGTTYTSDVTVTVRDHDADLIDPPIFEHTIPISSFISPVDVIKLDVEILNPHFGHVVLNGGDVADGDSFLFIKNTAVTFRVTPTGTNKLVSLKLNGEELPKSAWSKIGSDYIVTLTGLNENSVFTVQFEDQNSPLPPLTGVGSLIGWLIVVIVAFLLAAGAYIWYRNEKNKKRADMEHGEEVSEQEAPSIVAPVESEQAVQSEVDNAPVETEPAETPEVDNIPAKEVPSGEAEAPAEPTPEDPEESARTEPVLVEAETVSDANEASTETTEAPESEIQPAGEVDNANTTNEQTNVDPVEGEQPSDETIKSDPYLDIPADADETH